MMIIITGCEYKRGNERREINEGGPKGRGY
jgi:hypothetical protein